MANIFSVSNVTDAYITVQNPQEKEIIIGKNILNRAAGGYTEFGVLTGGKTRKKKSKKS